MSVGGVNNRLNSVTSASRSQGASKAAQTGNASGAAAAASAGPVAPVGNVDQLCILTEVKGQASTVSMFSDNVLELNMNSQHMDALSNFCKINSTEAIESDTISKLANRLADHIFSNAA